MAVIDTNNGHPDVSTHRVVSNSPRPVAEGINDRTLLDIPLFGGFGLGRPSELRFTMHTHSWRLFVRGV